MKKVLLFLCFLLVGFCGWGQTCPQFSLNNLYTFNITQTSANIAWTNSFGYTVNVIVRYRKSGDLNWNTYSGTSGQGSTTYLPLSNLNPHTIYEFQIKTICPNGSDSEYTLSKNFTTDSSSPTGILVSGGNGQGTASNQLNRPKSVFVTPEGDIYVSDHFNHRVQKWANGATSGITVAGGNGAGNASNQLNYPMGIFVDNSKNVFVADVVNNRIQKWAPNATVGITVAGGYGAGNGLQSLSHPRNVFVDESNNIYVNDVQNRRVMKWVPNATQGILVLSYSGHSDGFFITSNGTIYIYPKQVAIESKNIFLMRVLE